MKWKEILNLNRKYCSIGRDATWSWLLICWWIAGILLPRQQFITLGKTFWRVYLRRSAPDKPQSLQTEVEAIVEEAKLIPGARFGETTGEDFQEMIQQAPVIAVDIVEESSVEWDNGSPNSLGEETDADAVQLKNVLTIKDIKLLINLEGQMQHILKQDTTTPHQQWCKMFNHKTGTDRIWRTISCTISSSNARSPTFYAVVPKHNHTLIQDLPIGTMNLNNYLMVLMMMKNLVASAVVRLMSSLRTYNIKRVVTSNTNPATFPIKPFQIPT